MTPRPLPTDTVVLLRQTYAASVDALVWAFLYYKLGKIPPTTPLREVLSADELKFGVDPALPIGDVLPHDTLVQACHDACGRAADLLGILDAASINSFSPASEMPFLNLPGESDVENVAVRLFEILCDLISTRASMPGSVRERSWSWEDFSGCKLETRSGKEVRKFLKTPTFKYDDLTPDNNWNLNFIRQEHNCWCRCKADRRSP